MKRITSLLILLALTLGVSAQKKDISKAKDYLKSGKDLDKAEQLMTGLLKDSANRSNKKIWLTLFDAQRKQYEQANEKLYLKQKYDTAAFFNLASRMFASAEALDSLEMRPDKNGKTDIEYRRRHSEYLNLYRPNLYNGGAYFIAKKKYSDAYKFFDQYIDCAEQPLFGSFNYNENDTLMPTAAYWAVYCGYKMQDTKSTLHHTYMALKDKEHYSLMLQYLAETYKLENDSARYLQTLDEGFRKYPKFPFFFPRLIEFYASRGQWEKAMETCDYGLKSDPKNQLFRLVKSSVLLNQGKYDDCIALCGELLADSCALSDVQLNMGLAYFNKAVELDKTAQTSRATRNKINELYKKAMPYLEDYRRQVPDKHDRWALPLYTIYLNLNMGKQFDEIDKILKQ